ncbi:MAG: LytTR family DNA-binding domain-containing protein [Ruminococcus flavefaciens]|nr:LytTR family DNA-binding domain-containing protein [Ruminococcus flavefaciens]
MIRIAIVDDEDIICNQIEDVLNNVSKALGEEFNVDIYNSGETLINNFKNKEKYDLIFLDIELYECSGIDVGHFIRDEMKDDSTQIAFVSGKNGYDRMLFEFRPINFVEKPITTEKIMNVIAKYIRIYGNQSDVFKYKVKREIFFIDINEIIYFESNDRKIVIKKKNESEEFYGTIEKIKQQLKGRGFFMPHRSYLLNYRFIRGFRSKSIIMTNGDEIPIADNRKEEIFKIQIMMENGGKFYGL